MQWQFCDSRTKELHNLDDQNSTNITSSESITNRDMDMIQENESETNIGYESSTSASSHQFGRIQQNVQENETTNEPEFVFLPRRRVKRYTNRQNSQLPEHEDLADEEIEFTIEDDRNTEFSQEDISTSDEEYS